MFERSDQDDPRRLSPARLSLANRPGAHVVAPELLLFGDYEKVLPRLVRIEPHQGNEHAARLAEVVVERHLGTDSVVEI